MKLRDRTCHCGWKFPGFHICVDLSTPEPKLPKLKKISPAQKEALDEGSRERWRKHHEETQDRDKAIVEAYKEGDVGYRDLMEQFHVSQATIQKVMKRAEEAGELTIRKRGQNISRGA